MHHPNELAGLEHSSLIHWNQPVAKVSSGWLAAPNVALKLYLPD